MKIIVTAGHKKSIHTICLLHDLISNGHEVVGVFVVQTFQIKRLKNYIRQYGFSTVIAKFRSHFLHQKNSTLSKETKYINEYRVNQNIEEIDVLNFAKKRNIPLINVSNLNSQKSISTAKELAPDIIVYSGGGILKKEFIDSSRYTVLNAHSGPLPKVRGMNCIEWSILLNLVPTTTIHLIDAGIDTGFILYQESIPYLKTDSLYDIRGKATVHNIELLLKVLNNFNSYYESKCSQKKKDGRQYFVMHENLKKVVNQKLASAN